MEQVSMKKKNFKKLSIKVPSLKEVNFGKVKLWAVEHFWIDFDLRKRRDNKMGTYKTFQHETNNKILGKKKQIYLKKTCHRQLKLNRISKF